MRCERLAARIVCVLRPRFDGRAWPAIADILSARIHRAGAVVQGVFAFLKSRHGREVKPFGDVSGGRWQRKGVIDTSGEVAIANPELGAEMRRLETDVKSTLV